MPRKSSKTAHVLNLLTSNKDDTVDASPAAAEPLAENLVNDSAEKQTDITLSDNITAADTPAAENVTAEELPDSEMANISKDIENIMPEIIEQNIPIAESLGDMLENVTEILSDPPKEIEYPPMETITPTQEQKHSYDTPIQPNNIDEKPPFAYTASDKPVISPEITASPLSKSAIASMLIAQQKADEQKQAESEPVVEITPDIPVYEEKDMTLVNLTEKSAAKRIPDIMKRFNMCTCERCYYDVLALTLNNIPQKTVIIPKEDIEQKLKEYELESTIDMVTAISKSCVHVKISPRH